MNDHFYSHLVEIDTISHELEQLNLKKNEHEQLLSIVKVQIHHVAVDTVLSELTEDQKNEFLKHLHAGKHEKTWKHVNKHIKNAEKKIKLAVDKLLVELKGDIKESIKEEVKKSKQQ